MFKHSQELGRNYLSELLPKTKHSLAFGRYNAYSSLGFILGPLVGGHIADSEAGYNTIAMVTAAIFFVSSGRSCSRDCNLLPLPDCTQLLRDSSDYLCAASLNLSRYNQTLKPILTCQSNSLPYIMPYTVTTSCFIEIFSL